MNSFQAEFQTATKAVTTATAAASTHIGDLLRDHLHTVATLLINTEDATVDSCYDSDGQPIDYDETGLIDSLFEQVSSVLDQVLSLGATPEALVRNGWKLTHPRPYASFPVRTKTDDHS